jgi:hypothetical protein
MQTNTNWVGVWLEGVDPPRRLISTPNVTAFLLANMGKKGSEDFGFLLVQNRLGQKKKERESDAKKDLSQLLDLLPVADMKAWCQMPGKADPKPEGEPNLEKLTALVQKRCPQVTIELPEPTAYVLVASMAQSPFDSKTHGSDPDLTVLDRFDDGFSELLREARRVSGLVRKQWFIAVVIAKPEPKDDVKAFELGVGMATDRNVARHRALHAAEVRAEILTEAMFKKNVPLKSLPDAPGPS